MVAMQQHRILIYTTCYNVLDGVVLTIRKIEQEILAAGHHVCILTTKSGDPKNTHLDGEHPNRTVIFLDNSIPIPFLHDPHHPESSYQLGFALSKETKARIAEFEPSLIHITVPDCTCLHLIQYARQHEIPLMGTYHSNIPEYMSHYPGLGWLKHILAAFFRHQYNFLQALYVPTPYIHRYLTDTFKMDRVTDLGVWGRGIDLERFSPSHRSMAFRRQMGFQDDDVVIMWCGRLVPEKRPDIFCKVVQSLHERQVPFKALVVGAGPVEEEVKDLPNTVFAGWMNGDDLATAYASSDIFLFPSAVETFGNVTLEAAASGLPLVVEEGCSGHLVNHGVNGFACADNDVDAYLDGTLCLVLDDVRRKAMSSESRTFSLQFEKSEVCRRMLQNYSTVTDEFYRRYGGLHSNRDKAYQNEDSFLGGNHPRPTILVLVELVFILLFTLLYRIAAFFHCMRQLVVPSAAHPQPPVEEVKAPKKLPQQQPSGPRVKSQLALRSPLDSIEEAGDCSDSDTDTHDSRLKRMISVPLKGDDDTDSTASLSDEWSSGGKLLRNKPCCTAPKIQVSHMLAKGFVLFLQWQFRMESRVRNFANESMTPGQWSVSIGKKRKDSSMEVDLLDLEKRHSGDCESQEELEYLVNVSREDRLNMRRSNIALSELS